jgi:hypothetical protein
MRDKRFPGPSLHTPNCTKFDQKVTNMGSIIEYVGYSSPLNCLDLPSESLTTIPSTADCGELTPAFLAADIDSDSAAVGCHSEAGRREI